MLPLSLGDSLLGNMVWHGYGAATGGLLPREVADLVQTTGPLLEIVLAVVEVAVLVVVLRETRQLGAHQRELRDHVRALDATQRALDENRDALRRSRPLTSQFYEDRDEIMTLAIESLGPARELYALGSFRSAMSTERRPHESGSDFSARKASEDSKSVVLARTTRAYIERGAAYSRIMNFMPSAPDDPRIDEILANVTFFKHLLDYCPNLHLYHNPSVIIGLGDFHFRCTDSQVVLRVGGHGNASSNAAIAISDGRVVEHYRQYFMSLVSESRDLSREDLDAIEAHLLAANLADLRRLLDHQPAAS